MPALKQFNEEKGVIAANINHARGTGRLSPLSYRGIGEETEKEILSVVVDADQADELFIYIFNIAEIDRPHGGVIFQTALTIATHYEIPTELPFEK